MTVRLTNNNLQDMVVDLPVRMFTTEGTCAYDYQIDNEYAKATFKELRTPDFCVIDHCMVCKDDTKMYSKADEYNAIWFCAAMQGNVSCFYNPRLPGTKNGAKVRPICCHLMGRNLVLISIKTHRSE